jgi:hypothetical protein
VAPSATIATGSGGTRQIKSYTGFALAFTLAGSILGMLLL